MEVLTDRTRLVNVKARRLAIHKAAREDPAKMAEHAQMQAPRCGARWLGARSSMHLVGESAARRKDEGSGEMTQSHPLPLMRGGSL